MKSFLAWCEQYGISEITAIQPLHVAGYREALRYGGYSVPTVKQHLAAIRVRIPTMSIGHSDLMPIRAERSDAGLSQCETLIGIRQDFCHFC